MVSLRRSPEAPPAIPLPSKKQRISAKDSVIFPYPAIPADSIDHHNGFTPGQRTDILLLKLVPKTESLEWGNENNAAARAYLELTVTESNRELIRTHHPSLSQFDRVWVIQESDKKQIWVVKPEPDTNTIATHAGGQEIHFFPYGLFQKGLTTTYHPRMLRDPIPGTINPRRFLPQNDLNELREMFPSAVGVRVFISRTIVILFKDRVDIEASWKDKAPASEFGGLRLFYDVIDDVPTRKVLFRGSAIAATPDNYDTAAALGLKLRFHDGREVITVPTHAFIKVSTFNTTLAYRVADLYMRVKKKLARFTPLKGGYTLPGLFTTREEPSGNSPLNEKVFLAGGSQSIGTITTTYDPIPLGAELLRFPSGFNHDLSLVDVDDASQGLRVTAPIGTPQVVGWGDYKDALDGNPLFVTGFNSTTGRLQIRTGRGVSEEGKKALAEGVQYTWDKEALSQSASILWRTENDGDSLMGYSGSALCLGQISDRTCLAICFQNFDTPMYSREFLKQQRRTSKQLTVSCSWVHGGFILPADIRMTEILCDCDEPQSNPVANTYPSRQRTSTELRRSFSSHRG